MKNKDEVINIGVIGADKCGKTSLIESYIFFITLRYLTKEFEKFNETITNLYRANCLINNRHKVDLYILY